MNRILSIAFASGLVLSLQAQTTRVLFIGNSYTSVNDLPEMTRQLALSLGDTLIVANSSPGGYTFQQHTANAATQGLIDQGNWDFVVLQEQSQLPSFPPSQVAAECLPYAQALVDTIRAHSPCAEPVFYMTWGRQNGDAQNCASWPPVCTYEGMQQQLRQSYLQMAQDNNAACAPAGMAWKRMREEFPAINLYSSDGSHPSVAGTYLVACTMYSTFFRSSTVGPHTPHRWMLPQRSPCNRWPHRWCWTAWTLGTSASAIQSPFRRIRTWVAGKCNSAKAPPAPRRISGTSVTAARPRKVHSPTPMPPTAITW